VNEEKIKADIKAYMSKRGGAYREWYVGITSDPDQRLFTDHRVNRKGDAWIYKEADSTSVARSVESYFVNICGTDGGTGGGGSDAKFVYAYKKATHTEP